MRTFIMRSAGIHVGMIVVLQSRQTWGKILSMNSSFIVDPNAGNGRGLKLWNKARAYMDRRGMKYDIYFTTAPGDATDIAGELSFALDSDKTIFAIGGDDILSEVLNGLKHTDRVILGYIPVYVRYGLARSLRLKANPKVLIRDYLSPTRGRIETIDYGVLTADNGELTRRFINSAGIGFDAELYRDVSRKLGENRLAPMGIGGSLSLYGEILKSLFFRRTHKGYLILDDTHRVEFNNLILVSAHIHPYEYKFRFGNFADPKDGMLEICAISCREKLKFFNLIIKSRLGRLRNSGRVRLLQCSELHVHFDKECAVHADGEILGNYSELDLRCVSGQLRIMR